MRIQLMGCAVDNLDLAESLALIEGFIRSGRPHRHGALSGNDVVRARRDPDLRRLIDGCDLINAEGRPLQWGSRLLGRPLKARVPRRALFEALMARAAQRGWKVFLLGTREDEAAGVARRHPGLAVAGHRRGGWHPAEEDDVVAQICAARPEILCVALGASAAGAFLASSNPISLTWAAVIFMLFLSFIVAGPYPGFCFWRSSGTFAHTSRSEV